MPRSFAYTALTLRVRNSGESNREAWFLSAEEGLIHATVFGGPKSRLRARVAPFHQGTLYIYHDPVRDSRKVVDFDVVSYRPGIRELYERAMAANATAETILASHGGGGNWDEAIKLAGSVLDALDSADAPFCTRLAVCFFWQWAGVLGQRPDFSYCASCEKTPEHDEILWYSPKKEAFFCESCVRRMGEDSLRPADSSSYLRLDPGPRLWLSKTEALLPAELSRVSLDTVSLEQAKNLSLSVLSGALGKKLPTWDGV